MGSRIKTFLDSLGRAARQASDTIVASIADLEDIARTLRSAQRDLSRADQTLSELVMLVRLEQVPQVLWADWRTGWSVRAALSAAFVENTAQRLQGTEARLVALAAKILG